jgi:hypothetical protein
MGWTPDATTSGVFTTLVLQGAIGIVVYFVYESMRMRREVFFPKRRSKPERCPKHDPSPSFFGWLTCTRNISDVDTLQMVGMDGYIMLRFLRMCATVLIGCGIFSLVFLLPIFATAAGDDEVVGINRLTIANITSGGARLWAPWICCYIFSFVMLYMLYKEYEAFVQLRRGFLVQGDPDLPTQHLCAATIENIPHKYRSNAGLKALFEEHFPGQVVHAEIGLHTNKVTKLEAERQKYVVKLEKAVAAYEASDQKEQPMVSLKKGEPVMCGGDEKVEAIPYYLRRLTELNDQMKELKNQKNTLSGIPTPRKGSMLSDIENQSPRSEREESKDAGGAVVVPSAPMGTQTIDGTTPDKNRDRDSIQSVPHHPDVLSTTGTGYVTFRSPLVPSVACAAPLLNERHRKLKAYPAPMPNEILWQNVSAKPSYIRFASLFSSLLLYTGLAFWGAILAFIAAISTLSNLEKFLPFLSSLDPVSYGILQGQLPVIVLIIFISLLPLIFATIATNLERRKTVTAVRMQVFYW